MEKKDWKERLREFPFIRMYLLKKFKANSPREQGMADILTFVKDKEFHDLIDLISQELDKAREEGRLSVIQELLFEPEEPSHNISTLEAAFKYEDIIKRYSEEWRNKTKLISPKYIKSKLKDNK